MTEDKKIFATPKVRKFARELGANVSQIKGTERKGRITEEDVKTFVSNQLKESKNIEVDNQSSEKIRNELGWKGKIDFDVGIERTVKWYLSNQELFLDFYFYQ